MIDQPAQAVLEETLAAWSAAASPWRAAALAALYTEDACLFGGRPGQSVGRAAIEAYFASYDGIIGRAAIRPLDLQISQLDRATVVAQGHVEFTFLLASGKQTQSLLCATLILRQEAGGWRIWRHHFSPPPETPPLGDG